MSRIWLPGRRHLAEGLGVDRRAVLAAGLRAGGGALAALALAGCNSRGPRGAQGALRAAERWNERVERKLFRPTARNVPSTRAPAAGLKFPSYFVSAEMPVWDEAQRGVWRLEVRGLFDSPMRLTLDEIKSLTPSEARLEHFSVEGCYAKAVRTVVSQSDLSLHYCMSPDARYVGANAATFVGTGQATQAVPALDTSGSFSVAAWVRHTAGSCSGNETAVSIDADSNGSNNHASAYFLGYNCANQSWRMWVADTNAATPSVAEAASAAGSAVAGRWTHLLGVFNENEKRAVLEYLKTL